MKKILLPLLALALTANCQTTADTQRSSKYRIAQLKKLSLQYKQSRSYYANGIFIGYEKDQVVLSDLDGNVHLKGDYEVVPQNNSDLLMIQTDSLIGFMHRNGKLVLPLEFDPTGECSCHIDRLFEGDGTYTLCRKGKYGIVDSAGNIIVPFVLDHYCWLDGSRRWLFRPISSKNRYDYYMEVQSVDGKVKIGPHHSITGPFYNYFIYTDNDLMGCIDTNGNELLECRYEEIVNVGDGRLALKENGKWSLFHLPSGRRSYPQLPNIEFNSWIPQQQPLILCYTKKTKSDNQFFGAIDTNGNIVIPFCHENTEGILFYRDYLLVVGTDKSFVYDSHNGQLLKQYDHILVNYFEDDCYWGLPFLAVQQDSLWGIVDSNFNSVLSPTYHSLYILDRHNAVATLANGESALIDFQGHILFQGPFENFYAIDDGLYTFRCYNPDKLSKSIFGYCDRWGNSTITRKEMRQARQWKQRRQEKKRKRQQITKQTTTKKEFTTVNEDEEIIFITPETSAQFPGGDSALYMFICMNLDYPEQAMENNIEGIVFVNFSIEKDGSITEIKVAKDIGGGCGEAVAAMVKSMPNWIPGKQGNKYVRQTFTLPIQFSLTDDDATDNMTKEQKCQFLLKSSPYKTH